MSENLKPMTVTEFEGFVSTNIAVTGSAFAMLGRETHARIAVALKQREEAMELLGEICERDGYEEGDGDPDDFGDRAAALLKEAKDG